MMQPTPPHDHTTLPVSPRFHSHSQTPRPAASIQRVHFTGDPHYDSDPRGEQSFGPRDGRPAVRQWPKTGLLYSLSSAAYTSSPSSPHSPRIAPLSPLHQDLNMNAFAQSTDYHLLTLDQPRPRQRSMIPAYSARKEQLFARKKAPTAMDVKASSKILSALPAKQSSELQMAAKSKAKDIMSKIRAKRIPVDLFDKNFGFSISSRRRSRIESPQVSPRTSISLDEPLRRERIDSTDSAFTDFSFGNNTASSTSSYGGLEPCSPTLKPSRTTSFSAETGEAHPGQPVEFPCSDDANEAEEEEHSYIGFRTVLSVGADLNRLASFPPSSPSDIDMIDPLDMSPNTNSLAGRKRAHSTSPTSPTTSTANKRPAPPMHARSLPFTAAAAAVAPHMQRTRSDGSAEVFLAHVRASFEARREKEARCEKYDVFRDEETKGFLDSRPL